VHRTKHNGVRVFAAPDLQPTLEGAQEPIAIGGLVTAHVMRGELAESLAACSVGIRLAEARDYRSALLNWLRGTAMVLLLMGASRKRANAANRRSRHLT
jgi:hypothetical protein